MDLTGYEDHELDSVEEILDDNPATSADVYRSTIAFDPRAIAAVAAKRAGTGGGASALDDLTDVDLTGASDGDVLTKDGSDWIAQAPAGGSQPGAGIVYDLTDRFPGGVVDFQYLLDNGPTTVFEPTGSTFFWFHYGPNCVAFDGLMVQVDPWNSDARRPENAFFIDGNSGLNAEDQIFAAGGTLTPPDTLQGYFFTEDPVVLSLSWTFSPSGKLTGPVGTWQANHVYTAGDSVIENGFLQLVTTGGTSGGSEPSWDESSGTTTDNTVEWLNISLPTTGAVHLLAMIAEPTPYAP